MVCNFLFENLEKVSPIYKQGGAAKKQPADCPLHSAFLRCVNKVLVCMGILGRSQ